MAFTRLLSALAATIYLGALAAPAQADLRKLGVTPFLPKPVTNALRNPDPDLANLSRILCPIPKHELALLTLDKRNAPPSTLQIQQALAFFGFEPGPLDGLPGPATRRAATTYAQSLFNKDATCLHWRSSAPLVKAMAWAQDQDPDNIASIAETHGRLGLVRAYYSRNLPAPAILTPKDRDQCKAHDNAHLLGKPFTKDMRAGTGAKFLRVLRVLTPGPITMDLRPYRLNLELDGYDQVFKISCG